jgi:outer membrane immunogenic protein
MNGSDVWAAYNVASSLAAVAQFSVQHASNVNGSSADLTLKSYLFGARYSRGNSSRFAPFVQALFGGSHAGTNLSSGGPVLGNTANSLALAAGGGLDISLARHFACAHSRQNISGPSSLTEQMTARTTFASVPGSF